MRPRAQVRKFPLAIEADRHPVRQVLNQFHLVRLPALLHKGDCLLPGQFKAFQFQFFLADPAHFLLDFLHMLRSEREGGIQIVVKAVLNGRSDGEFHFRIQPLHRLGQHMGTGVPVGFPVFRVLKGKFPAAGAPGAGFFFAHAFFFSHVSNSSFGAAKIPPLLYSGMG